MNRSNAAAPLDHGSPDPSETLRGRALLAECMRKQAPEWLDHRVTLSRESLKIAARHTDYLLAAPAHREMLAALAEAGRAVDLDRALSSTGWPLAALPDLDQHPETLWYRSMRATLDGQTGRALQLASAARALTQGTRDDRSEALWREQRAVIRCMQGKARPKPQIEPLPLELIARESNWLASACSYALSIAHARDQNRAREMQRLLLPFEGRLALRHGAVVWGPVSRPLAHLAESLGEHDDAVAHYRRAIELTARIGAHPWLAQTQIELARYLLRQGTALQPNAAETLARDALAAGTSLQLGGIIEPARRVLSHMRHGT